MRVGVQDVKTLDFTVKPTPEAVLSVYEHPGNVPYAIARTFVVNAHETVERGAHAHKECHQIMVCLNGTINVQIKDGTNTENFTLSDPGRGLLVPAGLWAEQSYTKGSVLMVLASHTYSESDYIRDYNDYLAYMSA